MNSKIIKQTDYKAVNFVLQDVNLEFILDDINTSVINKMKFTNVEGEICLDGIDLELISISINDKILTKEDYKKNKAQLIIFSPPNSCTPHHCLCHLQSSPPFQLTGL